MIQSILYEYISIQFKKWILQKVKFFSHPLWMNKQFITFAILIGMTWKKLLSKSMMIKSHLENS